MKVRLKWQFGPEKGAVSHSGTSLFLLCEGGVLDSVSHLPEGRHGLRIDPADDQGRYCITAMGELVFLGGDKEYRTVLLPPIGKARFRCGDTEGVLHGPGGKPAKDPLVGTTFGGYQILSRLGAGAVGIVYRSVQTSLDREIALKVLSPQAAKSPQAVDSFVKEAQAAGRLSHPNLVQVHDVGQSEGNHYYAMELVPGGNLEEALADEGPLPWRKAVAYMRDCAKALAFAEEHGLVHRDVKPENLMRAQSGIVKLADLGLAATREMLDQEAAGGTPHFMAPEAAAGDLVDGRSDLYSLGCSLFRLITGKTLFEADTVRGILVAHRNQDPPTFAEADMEVPSDLEDILADLVAKSPDERYAHAQEVVEDLDALLASSGTRTGLWAALLVVVLGTTWGVREYLREDLVLQPEKIVEYVETGNSLETQAKLDAAGIEIAYRRALATQPMAARIKALEEFLSSHSNSAFAEQATEEQQRLKDAFALELAAAVAENSSNQESLLAFQALQNSSNEFKSASRWSEALAVLDQSPLSTDVKVVELRATIFKTALTVATNWQSQHEEFIQSNQWQKAENIESQWTQAFGSQREPWGSSSDDLRLIRAVAKIEADARDAFLFRQSLAQETLVPCLDAVLRLDFLEASGILKAAQRKHSFLAPLWKLDLESFRLASKLVREMESVAKSGTVRDFLVPGESRKSTVLDWTKEGLVVQVQIRGLRSKQVLPWSQFHQPDALLNLIEFLGTPAKDSSSKSQLYFLVARGVLAKSSGQIGENPEAIVDDCNSWLSRYPTQTAQTDSGARFAIAEIKHLEEIARAFRQANFFLALNRLEDFYGRWSLLAGWCSQGQADLEFRP